MCYIKYPNTLKLNIFKFKNILPSKCIEPAENIHLGLFRAGFHATLPALHQAGRYGAAGPILQERLARFLQLGDGGFDKGTGHVEGCGLARGIIA